MAENSNIEWTHHTFNPWRGCTKVSAGCTHCYADVLSKRNPGTLGIWGKSGTREIASESMWAQPVKWNEAAEKVGEHHRVFCASLADVFEGRETMPESAWGAVEAARVRLFDLIRSTPHLDWLLLTKRPENILPFVSCSAENAEGDDWNYWANWLDGGAPENVWLGTSVENQEAADKRIPELLKVPAVVRFLSCEPLLGTVDLSEYLVVETYSIEKPTPANWIGAPPTMRYARLRDSISWVIVGGESGPGARPMHPDLARSLRDQCNAARVPFLFKQWGSWVPESHSTEHDIWELAGTGKDWHRWPDGSASVNIGKKAAGRVLDGRTWDEYPIAASTREGGADA
jgi:protein gp37